MTGIQTVSRPKLLIHESRCSEFTEHRTRTRLLPPEVGRESSGGWSTWRRVKSIFQIHQSQLYYSTRRTPSFAAGKTIPSLWPNLSLRPSNSHLPMRAGQLHSYQGKLPDAPPGQKCTSMTDAWKEVAKYPLRGTYSQPSRTVRHLL
jgi:hypothetical protein